MYRSAVDLARRTGVAYVALVGLGVMAGVRWVRPLHLGLDGAPFVGGWRWPVGAPLLLPILVATGIAVRGPALAQRLRWPLVPAASGAAAAGWAVALAVTDGWSRLTAPVVRPQEYERFAAGIDDPGAFLRTFAERVPDYPVHVRAHPPFATLVPWAMDHLGAAGAGWFAALLIASWGVAIASVLVAVRAVAGEVAARRVAPALVLLPAAVWAATSSDAMFAGVFAVGVAVAVLGRRWQAVAGGVVLAAGLMLTYGGAVLLVVPVVVHLRARRFGHVAAMAAAVAAVLVGGWAATGFWWLDGLEATRRTYWDGVASVRPGLYLTAIGNPTALLVLIGPAAVAGLVLALRARSWATLVLPLAGLAAVTAANLSQLSRGEVERIWLLFAVWVAAAAIGDRRRWLAAQAAVGVAAQALVASPW